MAGATVAIDGLRLQDSRLIEIGWNVLQGLLLFLVVLVIARLVRTLAARAMARQNVRTDAADLAARVIYVSLLGLGVFLFATTALGSAAVGLTGVLVAVWTSSTASAWSSATPCGRRGTTRTCSS